MFRNPMPTPLLNPSHSHPRGPPRLDDAMDDAMDVSDASDTPLGCRTWANKMDKEDLVPPSSTEDDLMDAWLEATKNRNADGSVFTPPSVVKLVMVLLRKTSPPPTKTGNLGGVNEFKASALVIRWVPDQTPFEGMPASQIVQNVNLALESIGAELNDQAIRITAVAVL
ncbi:hypothetical protein CROQUDRAFT_101715 [Cronartium quercuum f. sp. fusiforme G11]|uniref:Uncharacterized protein n=1 Tax=Cronartium quercuum f. sp. fusiforme G11 TaxID=708437 RepID=A0A9P6N7S4_9BASI|nr:hypothetical protein CROQUDRAFT_101715 [Cronartium quercuum f. sp. fusiforme G11]